MTSFSSLLSAILSEITGGNLFAQNLLAWAIQVTILTAAGIAAERLLRSAKLRLYLWQAILAVAVLLPMLEPWSSPPPIFLAPPVAMLTPVATPAIDLPAEPAPIRISLETILMGGVLLRLLWLAIGVVRLGMLRRGAIQVDGVPAETAPFLFRDLSPVRWFTSRKIHGPVTFGWPSPCVLLPQRVLDLPADQQRAIAQHELVHADRNDWLYVIAEELLRAALWFHPAVWFVLAKIGLAREQVVDQEVVALTENRDGYLNALVSVASSHLHAGSAPAPLFLKRRQLATRIAAVLKETPMQSVRTKTLRVAGAAALSLLLTGAAIAMFPLMIEAQVLTDAEGVTVDTGAPVIHRTTVQSQGDTSFVAILDAELDADGNVTSVTGISGPKEYMQQLESEVSQWHYVPGPRTARVMIKVTPTADAGAGGAQPIGEGDSVVVKSVAVLLPAQEQKALQEQMNQHIGETWTAQTLQQQQDSLNAQMDAGVRILLNRSGQMLVLPVGFDDGQHPLKVAAIEFGDMDPDLLTQVQSLMPPVGGTITQSELGQRREQLRRIGRGLNVTGVSMSSDQIWLQVEQRPTLPARDQVVNIGGISTRGNDRQFLDEIRQRLGIEIGQKRKMADVIDFRNKILDLDPNLRMMIRQVAPNSLALEFRMQNSVDDALRAPRRIDSIRYIGLPEELERRLKQQFPMTAGAEMTMAGVQNLQASVRRLDEHLQVSARSSGGAEDPALDLTFSLRGSPPPPPPGAVRIAPYVIANNLVKSVPPVYPLIARTAHVQGVVKLEIVIDEEGHVTSEQLISGHPMLIQAAQAAVQQWVYRPTLLNGNAVPVITQAEVQFSLFDGGGNADAAVRTPVDGTVSPAAQKPPPPPPPPDPVLIAGSSDKEETDVDTLPHPTLRVEPEMPPIAKQIKLQGEVILSVLINEQGAVEEMHVVSGHPILTRAAMEAVRQWGFAPGTKDGEPVPARATVEVSFRNL